MLHIVYENKNGRLDFNGGKGRYPWRILEIEGLGLTEKDYETAQYPGGIGQRTLSETLNARTISIQCDVNSMKSIYYISEKKTNRREISKALKILNEPGTLIISDRYRTRKIMARCAEAVQGERHGGYTVFAMQFVCDYPYFEDKDVTVVPLFKVDNLIGTTTRWCLKDGKLTSESIETGKFVLPCLFTRRTARANVINVGDIDAEPIIRIKLNGERYSATTENFGMLVINNESAKQKIELNLQKAENTKEVIVDIPNRKIYSQDNQNLIHYLSPTSFLSDFWLQKGDNLISVDNFISSACVVECEFSNKYVEAVIG